MPRTDANHKSANIIKSVVPQCKVVVYNWTTDILTVEGQKDTLLTESQALDISSQVINCTYNKNINSPAGTFTFTLSNSPGIKTGDWKDIIKRGSWCLIYMSQDGDLLIKPKVSPPDSSNKQFETPKLRCVGFIDRVAAKGTVNERGAIDVVYEVSGRDFGVVYEDCVLWQNIFETEKALLDAVQLSGLSVMVDKPLDEALEVLHNLFYNPIALQGKLNLNAFGSLTSIAKQWLMPRKMLVDLGLKVDRDPYWGELFSSQLKRFSPTLASLSTSDPSSFYSGQVWGVLKKVSVPQFHELFTELDSRGRPTLVFRPIPRAIDKAGYPNVGKNVLFYKDLPKVIIRPEEVFDFDMGEDNHSRYNSFLVIPASSLTSVQDIAAAFLTGSNFPRHIQDSIKRYGFRPMHVTVESLVRNTQKQDGIPNPKLLLEYSELLYDYWNNVIYAESGQVAIVGRNDIRVGKAIGFTDETAYLNKKRYYLEGYTDQYMVDERGASTWTQNLVLTYGYEEVDLKNKSGFGKRSVNFAYQGEFTPTGRSKG